MKRVVSLLRRAALVWFFFSLFLRPGSSAHLIRPLAGGCEFLIFSFCPFLRLAHPPPPSQGEGLVDHDNSFKCKDFIQIYLRHFGTPKEVSLALGERKSEANFDCVVYFIFTFLRGLKLKKGEKSEQMDQNLAKFTCCLVEGVEVSDPLISDQVRLEFAYLWVGPRY